MNSAEIPVAASARPTGSAWAAVFDEVRPNRLAETLFVLSLLTLVFPALFAINAEYRLIYGHYFGFALLIPFALLQCPMRIRLVLFPIGLILLSTVINFGRAEILVAVFHALHLLAVVALSAYNLPAMIKITRRVLSAMILLVIGLGLIELFGLAAILPEIFYVADPSSGTYRLTALTTEPAAAVIIILILSRFIMMAAPGTVRGRDIALVLVALIMAKSLNGIIVGGLLLGTYVLEQRRLSAVAMLILAGSFGLVVLSQNAYFSERLAELDFSKGPMALGTGSIRLLPYTYIGDTLQHSPAILFWGAGAGDFESGFFRAYGQYFTSNDRLSGHMAESLYDYGIFFVLAIAFLNRPKKPAQLITYLLTTIVVFLNAGIGTYLFILYGAYSMMERKAVNRD
jgi:hypothetical protein